MKNKLVWRCDVLSRNLKVDNVNDLETGDLEFRELFL